MNWKLFALLAPIGPAIGTLTVFGVIPQGADRWIWSVVMLLTAWLVVTRASGRELLNGAAIGAWNGATSTALQAAFRETLFANNPWIREHFATRPNPVDTAYHLFLLIPFMGVAGGGMTGLLSMFLAWGRRRGKKSENDGGQTRP